jgi:hypothetical protein
MNNGGCMVLYQSLLPPTVLPYYAATSAGVVSGVTFLGAPRLITSPAAIFAARSANFF